jgi:hypothetical protein
MTAIEGLVYAQAAIIVVVSAAVILEYGKTFVRGAQLLPLHVALIALSYLVLTLVAAIEFGGSSMLTLSDLLIELAFAIGIVSLVIILTYERGRES